MVKFVINTLGGGTGAINSGRCKSHGESWSSGLLN